MSFKSSSVDSYNNYSTAFTHQMRENKSILGQLPYNVEPISKQVARHYTQYLTLNKPLQKNRYLHDIFQQSVPLFYALFTKHFKEMLPILYTPTVSDAVQTFNHTFLKSQALFIAWPDRDKLDVIFQNYEEGAIDIAVLTDGERILGLGDQGVGGVEICIAKSMLYILCAQIDPKRILPIYLDVGTNNQELLTLDAYKGWRNKRINALQYKNFIDQVVHALQRKFPQIYLHWEDLKRDNAQKVLKRYQMKLCNFNDDMQGTGVVTVASALNAMRITQSTLTHARIVIYGGGTAGIGIADQLCQAMQREGLTIKAARQRIWLIGRHGLLMQDSDHLTPLQKPYARLVSERVDYNLSDNTIDLLAVIKQIKPNFLIGCSGQRGAFTEQMIKTMAKYTPRPIIFPLSNPTENCEALPKCLLDWTQGKALIATGSPFEPVNFQNQLISITQCNNALAFPGIGLGAKASGATRLTDYMLWKACQALCDATDLAHDTLLPNMNQLQSISRKIACAVIKAAQAEGIALNITEDPNCLIEKVCISFES